MARGNSCPGCGKQTFHDNKTGALECSSCGAVGWLGDSHVNPGSGKGRKCGASGCGRFTLRAVADLNDQQRLYYCSSCDAIVVA